MADDPSLDNVQAQSDEARLFDVRRLHILVRFSSSLRWPMASTAVVVAAVAWVGGCPPPLVIAWLLATVGVREARAATLLRLDQRSDLPITPRLRAAAWWTLGLGLAHGASALFMLRLDTASDAVLTMLLISLSAGAVSTTFTVATAFIVYAVAISVPTALMWFFAGGWLGWSVGGLVLMFVGVQIRFARQNLQLFEESYGMRLENVALLRQLSDERSSLAQARDAAVQADLSKSRFLAAASHDLRQPLQSLSLNSGALSRMPLLGESRLIAAEIGAGIEALRQMLDALLDVSTLDAGGVTPALRPIPLDRLVDGICARFRSAAEAKGLHLDCICAAGIVVVSDADMLRRVVSNLIDNAIKFTSRGGITVSVQPDGGHIRLTVSDTGSGINAADQRRVFEDLEQLGNPQRDRAFGHGLGLGIVRRIAHLLGIDYAIESQAGVGTQFHLRLPLGERAEPTVQDNAGSGPDLAARRVLVLDDDEAVRVAYGHALKSLGCQVVCTGTLDEALASLASWQPEVALVDHRLGGQDNGLLAIGRLREALPGLAAIIVSADVSNVLRDEAAHIAAPVLRKPVTDATLVAAVNEAVREPGVRARQTPQSLV